MKNRITYWVFALFLAAIFICNGLYNLPPIHDRLAWRVDNLRTQIKYYFNPPDEAIFVPGEPGQAVTPAVAASPTPLPPTSTPTPLPAGPTPTAEPSPTPTITSTPLPDSVILPGVKYEDQHNRWNYCGPANLSMALTYWGWDGNRDIVGEYVKPEDKDKNVMPYEMLDFVTSQTPGMAALSRIGGDLDVLKRLIAGGYPVLVEKGYYEYDYTGKLGWLGHYQFVTGYDEARDILIVQDTYIDDGKDHKSSYTDFLDGWRTFNYLFIVVYPVDRAGEVAALLGPYNDPAWANQHAQEVALAETQALEGMNEFFAWFNLGSSRVALTAYADAATAFDQAFTLYAGLPDDLMRPYRVMWYQTGPYWAYYYSGRYQDVINLAETTLFETISEPVLEESFYWRGLAREALGDVEGAIADFRKSVELNPNFTPGWQQLERLGG